MTQPPPQHRPPRGRPSLSDRRRRERRVLAIGLFVSLALHVLALAIFSERLDSDAPATTPPPGPVLVEPPSGMRAIGIATVPDDGDPAPPEVPDPQRPDDDRDEPAPVMAAADSAPAVDRVAADDRTAADRLAPRVVDPRLWRPMVLIPREPTLEDVQARIAAAVELLSDSALAEADAAMRARDWTVEDEKGGRWGVSPGQLHLGSITLPLPIWFPVDPESAAAEAQWYELDQQLERTMIRESFEERVRSIRERRERERSESKGGEPGGGGG